MQLLRSNRVGDAGRTVAHVEARHVAIQELERTIIELAQMSEHLNAQVVQQEAAVMQVDQKGEQVTENVGRANQEMSGAVDKARSRNRKKWWCLLVVRMSSSLFDRTQVEGWSSLTSCCSTHHHRRRHHRSRRHGCAEEGLADSPSCSPP